MKKKLLLLTGLGAITGLSYFLFKKQKENVNEKTEIYLYEMSAEDFNSLIEELENGSKR